MSRRREAERQNRIRWNSWRAKAGEEALGFSARDVPIVRNFVATYEDKKTADERASLLKMVEKAHDSMDNGVPTVRFPQLQIWDTSPNPRQDPMAQEREALRQQMRRESGPDVKESLTTPQSARKDHGSRGRLVAFASGAAAWGWLALLLAAVWWAVRH